MLKRASSWKIFPLGIYILILSFNPVSAISGTIPTVDSYLPEFRIEVPSSEKERVYLELSVVDTFSMNQLSCQFVLIEIVGVYCPQCHTQMPLFNNLFYRIKKDLNIYKKIKMVAIAVGANPTEKAYFKKEYNIPYPVINDPKFKIHKLLGEPRTPFTMIVTRDQKVVFAHLGVIKNIDNFLLRIRKLIQ